MDMHELYDLSNDQGELINLVEIETTKVKQANDLLEQHKSMAEDIKQQLGLKNDSRKELDQETIEKLKSLGYIQ